MTYYLLRVLIQQDSKVISSDVFVITKISDPTDLDGHCQRLAFNWFNADESNQGQTYAHIEPCTELAWAAVITLLEGGMRIRGADGYEDADLELDLLKAAFNNFLDDDDEDDPSMAGSASISPATL